MIIGGLQKTTLLDYPGKVAATIFLCGCNMRCPFCHNMNLVNSKSGEFDEEYVFDYLKKRQGVLDGVCITGGEPTIWPLLPEFIGTVKSLKYSVKLDTNGTNPEVLTKLVSEKLIDYVAMDIKASEKLYPKACGVEGFDFSKVSESIDYLLKGNIDYEFRTTMVKQIHDMQCMQDIGAMIKGAEKYYLQSFVDSEYVPKHEFLPPDENELKSYREMLKKFIKNVELRGV